MASMTQQLGVCGAFFNGNANRNANALASCFWRPNRRLRQRQWQSGSGRKGRGTGVVRAVAVSNVKTRERETLMAEVEERWQRIQDNPMEGVSFSMEQFNAALDKFNFGFEIGTTVKGMVFKIDGNGAMVDISAKAPAFLPLVESSIHKVKTIEEVGLSPGMEEHFMILREDDKNSRLILSLRKIQYDLAWERCRQLQTEDVVVKGKVASANRGGVVVLVEGLRGFVPFSQISTRLNIEELVDKDIPLKFMEVDEEQTRLVLSNRKAMADNQAQLGIGSVVVGTVQSIKPYGAFVDLGGINGLLHVSQISHDRVTDVGTILQPGDSLKVASVFSMNFQYMCKF
eukprot:Gb_02217 [translate_table: standard]